MSTLVKKTWKPVEDCLREQLLHLFQPVRQNDIIRTIHLEVDQYWRVHSAA